MDGGFFQQVTSLEALFWFCALTGTVFFILRVLLMVIGGGLDSGVDADLGTHGPVDMGHAGHDGTVSDTHFEFISVNSITAFFMMFGWIGLTCYKQFLLNGGLSVVIGLLGGVGCMLITAYLFKLARKLVSKGDLFSLDQVVGKRGAVYQRIPAAGRGKINVVLNDITREIEAIAEDKQAIDSFQTVEVVRVVDQITVAVKKI
ncbi:MAG TPA: hypothetical protein PLT76_03850 [Candidatus Omnitrophota bacterium]|nr:hypothetical protein [Candidatus Omnitrophota bacterium]HPB68467.1 hypothetical protein [Candidatus Omnitrophota bacterium]HQO57834.1 hypothetical protein [Candidatus Omnitrophota bacterium]HQP13025.1 hypothetical protein [Candidatus Omnitrophota bacterium]